MKLFLQKNAKFSSAGGSALRPPCLRRLGALPPTPQSPAGGGFAPRPPKQPPLIADFWLRACFVVIYFFLSVFFCYYITISDYRLNALAECWGAKP